MCLQNAVTHAASFFECASTNAELNARTFNLLEQKIKVQSKIAAIHRMVCTVTAVPSNRVIRAAVVLFRLKSNHRLLTSC